MTRTVRTRFRSTLFLLCLALPLAAGAAETAPVGAAAQPATPVATPPPVTAQPAAQAVKLGYVNIAKIGKESIQGKAAQARFKAKADKLEAQIAAKQKQLEKQKIALEAKLATLPPDQRAAKAKEFEKKVGEFRKSIQSAQQEIEPLQKELSDAVIKEIERAAASYGKSNGFAAILTEKEPLYLGSDVEAQDVTDAVLKLVNEKAAP